MDKFACQLENLLRFTEAVRDMQSQLPVQCLHILLVVAAKPGVTQGELQQATGLAAASVSRNVAALGGTHRKGGAGLGLVAQVQNAADSRSFDLFLTTKGRDAMRRLLQAATGKPADTFSPRVVK